MDNIVISPKNYLNLYDLRKAEPEAIKTGLKIFSDLTIPDNIIVYRSGKEVVNIKKFRV